MDKRTDKIITGKRLFEGEHLSETMASVMKDRLDLSGVPAKVRRLLERCLEKDPKKRLRDIGDMELLLPEVAADHAHFWNDWSVSYRSTSTPRNLFSDMFG